ncbi:MAG: NAD(P)/FAD-dependent oxidoreductase [Bacteroidetes bacterium]|nr:NAD(P)/FAD-dependent oxidoreductase [Bacteroidota bacterium]
MSRIAIIGAGAAGCFAAANITGRHELRVFEKSNRPLSKVKVSGGGRCNVTQACFDVDTLLAQYPRGRALLKRSLHRFGPQKTIEWFEQRAVPLKAEADGRVFPKSNQSQSIIDCILSSMQLHHAQIEYSKALSALQRQGSGWQLQFSDGTGWAADRVLLACGGIQKAGQAAWLEALGHHLEPPAPSLFTFNLPGNPITQLMGLSVPEVRLKLAGIKGQQVGPLLITHWGLSGPCVLRTSAWAARALQEQAYQAVVIINWLHDQKEDALRELFVQLRTTKGKHFLKEKNPFGLPRRLWEFFLLRAGLSEACRWADLASGPQQQLLSSLLDDHYEMRGKTTFKEEFVTCGGVRLSEIDPHRMESRMIPGLFFAGEMMDVDGVTGGYNFQHAWSSGWIAAQALSEL